MQAEFPPPRGSGFIISGAVAPPKTKPRIIYTAEKKKRKLRLNIDINFNFSDYLKNAFVRYCENANSINKTFIRTAVSAILCVLSLVMFFKFFGFGTAIYQGGRTSLPLPKASNFTIVL